MLLKRVMVPVVTGLLVTSAVVWAVEKQHDENRERDMTEHAAVDMVNAIRAAQRATGGTAVAAGAEVERGKSYYEVTSRTAKGSEEVRVDASTGRITDRKRLSGAGDDGQDDHNNPSGARLTLAEAVGQAESHSGGKAMEAEAAREHGRPVYRIELAQGREIRKVTVDAAGHPGKSETGGEHEGIDTD